jgi:hypothetical protein
MRRLPRIACTTLLLLAGCATRPKPELCFYEAIREKRPVLSPDEWFAVLVHGFDAEKHSAPRPTLDCSGSPVVWQEPVVDECREPGAEAMPLPPKDQLTTEDLVMETHRADMRLVWVLSRRFSNGEALGPVGLVERTDQGLVVRGLGSLRSFPQNPGLRLERSGGVELLVAEGDQCTDEAPPVCRRFARILPLRHGRFFAESVTSEGGLCLGPTWFPSSREQVLQLPGGLHRKMLLTSELRFEPEGIVIDEKVTMQDLDPRTPSLAPRAHRTAQAARMLRVEGARLVGSEPSLWIRLLEQEVAAGAKPLAAPLVAAEKTAVKAARAAP